MTTVSFEQQSYVACSLKLPWQTFYNYLRHWQHLGVWQNIHTQLGHQVRQRLEKIDNPTHS